MSLTRVARSLVLLVLLSNLPGCAGAGSKPSEVAQGRYFAAGSPDYDEFFVAIHRLQLEMANAPREIADARRALSTAVVSSADASNAQLAEKVKATLERLADRGVRTRVEFKSPTPPDPEHTMALLTPWTNPTGNDRQAFEDLESSLTRILRFAATMRRASARLIELRSRVPRLEAGIGSSFRDQSRGKRRQVEQNLEDAAQVSLLMLARADELGTPAEALANELRHVLAPNFKLPASPPPASEPAPPSPEPPRPRPRAAPEPRAKAGAGDEAKPKAAPEPPKSADFEP